MNENNLSYEDFVNGEKKFGTEFDWSSQIADTTDSCLLKLRCEFCFFGTIKSRLEAVKSYNEIASKVLFNISKDSNSTPDRVAVLLCHSADPNFVDPASQQTPLHRLVVHSTVKCVTVLLKCCNVIHFLPDKNGMTPLMALCKATSRTASLGILQLLLSAPRCDINALSEDGLSALAFALKSGNIGLVRSLLVAGASVLNLTSAFLSTLLHSDNDDAIRSSIDQVDDAVDGAEGDEGVEDDLAQVEVDVAAESAVRQHRHNKDMDEGDALVHVSAGADSLYAVHLEELIKNHTVDYRRSVIALRLHKFNKSLSTARLCQQMVNYRLIEEERSNRKADVHFANKTSTHMSHSSNNAFSYGEKPSNLSERAGMRKTRKAVKLLHREPLATKKQRRELELWDVTRARILKKVDQQYDVNINLKGLFK